MTNLALLDTLPPWLLFALIVGGSMSLAAAATVIRRRRTKPPTDEAHNEVSGFIFAAVSVLYAVVLAFMVFAVWESYTNAKQASSNEAAALIAIARDSTLLPEPARGEVHALLREYANTVVNNEWKAMSKAPQAYDGSPQAQTAIDEVWATLQGLPRGAADSNTTVFLSNLSQQRAIRLQSNDTLPSVFVVVLLAGAALTISFCLILHMEDIRLHAGLTAILTGMIAICLWLILEMNHPYAGSLAVTPEAFEHAIHVIDGLPR